MEYIIAIAILIVGLFLYYKSKYKKLRKIRTTTLIGIVDEYFELRGKVSVGNNNSMELYVKLLKKNSQSNEDFVEKLNLFNQNAVNFPLDNEEASLFNLVCTALVGKIFLNEDQLTFIFHDLRLLLNSYDLNGYEILWEKNLDVQKTKAS